MNNQGVMDGSYSEHENEHILLGKASRNARPHAMTEGQHQIGIHSSFVALRRISEPAIGQEFLRVHEVFGQAAGDEILRHRYRLKMEKMFLFY